MRAIIEFGVSDCPLARDDAGGALPCTKYVATSRYPRLARSAGAGMRMLVAAAAAGAIAGCSQAEGLVTAEPRATPSQPVVAGQPGPTAEPVPASPQSFTKQEFAQHIQGMTKADIRREFGPPLVVHDDTDSWFYADLPVYDADAGIQVSLTIRFAGLTPAEADDVVEVSYQ